MALITKMHRCAFCGSSEVTVSENGTYTCRDCGKTADHGMPAADVEAVNRILMTGGDAETAEELRRRYPRLDLTTSNDCKYCMPCPYGIDIPAILLHYNKCINERHIPESSQAENYREARRAFLIGYDRSVPRLRQASHCIGCRQCEPHCPQIIPIASEMRRIDSFVENLKQGNVF